MQKTTSPPSSGQPVPLTADCRAAVDLDLPEAHRRCRGNGPLNITPFHAPVLPATPCGCSCHAAGGGAR